jgi:hypothetical protein
MEELSNIFFDGGEVIAGAQPSGGDTSSGGPPVVMAGCRITPVLVFWILRDLHWVEFTFETGFGLSSSWLTLPAYGSNRNRNILDFMK